MNAWGNAPSGEAWRPSFKLQEPTIIPNGDPLVAFVRDRIVVTESEPAAEIPMLRDQPAGPAAERYARAVHQDMRAFRVIVASYLEAVGQALEDHPDQFDPSVQKLRGRAYGLRVAVQAIADRWADHPDFRPEWRV